jgi:hypothetical protein
VAVLEQHRYLLAAQLQPYELANEKAAAPTSAPVWSVRGTFLFYRAHCWKDGTPHADRGQSGRSCCQKFKYASAERAKRYQAREIEFMRCSQALRLEFDLDARRTVGRTRAALETRPFGLRDRQNRPVAAPGKRLGLTLRLELAFADLSCGCESESTIQNGNPRSLAIIDPAY